MRTGGGIPESGLQADSRALVALTVRVLVSGAAGAAANMAIDEALLYSARRPGSEVTLRLYRFAQPALTFGYGQELEEAFRPTALGTLGVDRIRRITGGRALLHQHELTYSVTGPPLARSPKQVYAVVTAALRDALRSVGVGVDAEGTVSARRAPKRLPCLSVPSGHEITREGRKLVASAMRFRRDGFLQHGSILWRVDDAAWRRVTPLADDEPLDAVGIHDSSPHVTEAALVEALAEAMASSLGNGAFRFDELDDFEVERAEALAPIYRSLGWNRSRSRPETTLTEQAARSVDNSEAVW